MYEKTVFKQIIHTWMFSKHDLKRIMEIISRIGADGLDLTIDSGIVCPGSEDYLKMPIKSMLNDYGLMIPAITAGYVFEDLDHCHVDQKKRDNAINFTKRCIDVAIHVGCDRILVSPSFVSEKHIYHTNRLEDWKRAVDSLRQAGEYAQSMNVMLLIEPINRYRVSLVRNIAEAMQMIEDIDLPNIHIVPDTFHMQMEEEEGIPRALIHGGEHIKCLHVGDNTRRCPGFGTFDWRSIIGALYDIGFDGPLSYEPVSNDYSGNKVFTNEEYLDYFEGQLSSGINYLRSIMSNLN
jgi:D-psicose/D-tagatose/L-ribulose 3-epimerase